MAAQKQPYMCRAPSHFKVARGFTPQAAYMAAFKPTPQQVWICSEDRTDHYAAGEDGKRHYFVLIDIPGGA